VTQSTHDRLQLADHLAELTVLMPALRAALERDQGTSDQERVSAGGGLQLPVNADVMRALHLVDEQLPEIAQRAADVAGEAFVARSVSSSLLHLGRLHERLLVLAAAAEAQQLARRVAGLLREVRLAIGLQMRDRPVGQLCPMHDVDLVELVVPGDVGHLQYERVDSDGVPVAPRVSWVHTDAVVCRVCRASWVPAQYLLLGRMLAEADLRRTGQQDAA
jgi:hypothetical protein